MSATVSVRMYRHGLGDCFLVRIPKDAGGTFNMLIDCGLIAVAENPREKMQKVAADIAAVCGNSLDVVVMTHEHWDHASGFSVQQAQASFAQMNISEAWYAWTEDPDDALGKRLRKERESKLEALHRAATALKAQGTPLAADRAVRVSSLLAFFGFGGVDDLVQAPVAGALGAVAKAIGKTRAAFDYLRERRGVRKRYCRPSDEPMRLDGVSCARVYVLGPPQDEGMLKRSAPTKKGQEVYDFSADLAFGNNLEAAFKRLAASADCALPMDQVAHGRDCPFESSSGRRVGDSTRPLSTALHELISGVWDPPADQWRQIEADWTAAAEGLALNLDTHTNNTCLVLAIELIPSRRVLLFAADAQVGNWLSWQQTRWEVSDGQQSRPVTGPDLLERVAFYKVGHHGSHNATLRALGLERMQSSELVAFVPVFKQEAKKNRWDRMPFNALVNRLKQKTGGRLVFSDDQEASPQVADLQGLTAGEQQSFQASLVADPNKLFYEYSMEV